MALYIGNSKMRPMVGNTPMHIPVPLPYDAEIEYLESTAKGNQHFDLGIKFETPFRVVVDAHFEQPFDNGANVIFGLASSNGLFVGVIASKQGNYWGIGGGKNMYTEEIKPSKERVTADITFAATSQFGSIEEYPVSASERIKTGIGYVFGLPKSNYFIGYLYGIKVYDENNDLIADLIPVRIKTSGYLYDKLSNTMYKNQGQDGFLLGPDKH